MKQVMTETTGPLPEPSEPPLAPEATLDAGDPLPTLKPLDAPTDVVRTAWHHRLPGAWRFLFWNLFCWTFGAAALVGGVVYTEHVVKPVAEHGGTSFSPIVVFEKEAGGQRVFGNEDRINILLLGIDYNRDSKGIGYTKGARSDTIMVVSLSRDGEFLNMVSVPRDTRVFLGDDYGYDKINGAYSYGGIEMAKKVISGFLGVPIHHYVVVKVPGAKKMVDVIGGLPIDVEKDLDYDDNWGKLHIHLKQGPQILTGEQAVGYARFRMDEEGDRGRIRRQQQVIKALAGRVKEPFLIAQFGGIANAVKDTLETDLLPLEMVDLANLYSGFDFHLAQGGSVVGDDAFDAYGASYIEPYAPENERTVRRLLKSMDWVGKQDLRIRILFKSAAPEIAYRLADKLGARGFDGVIVQALTLEDPRDSSESYVAWSHKVPRLEGVLSSVTGKLPERKAGSKDSDDDLIIVVGDRELGHWGEAAPGNGRPNPTAGKLAPEPAGGAPTPLLPLTPGDPSPHPDPLRYEG